MITLYTFGPQFGLPDPSPFVMKAQVLLAMSGLPFITDSRGFRKAPKGKLPYLRDGETVIADSTLIRWHLENTHGIAFDAGYGPAETATGWAVEKMLEDHLYWAIVHARWVDDANFACGPAHFFKAVPAPVRPLVQALIRRKIRGNLHAQGLGRHDRPTIEALGLRSIAALSDILGDRPYLLGPAPRAPTPRPTPSSPPPSARCSRRRCAMPPRAWPTSSPTRRGCAKDIVRSSGRRPPENPTLACLALPALPLRPVPG